MSITIFHFFCFFYLAASTQAFTSSTEGLVNSSLYFLLIPEVWPDNVRAVEPLKTPAYYPQTVYNAEFYRRLKQLVPPESFQPGAERKKALDISDLRTVSPDEKSPLTSADVQAFARTIPAVNKLASAEGMALKLFAAGQLLDKYESEQNGCTVINTLKDLVYPCRRLVQKMRILGMETDLKLAVGGEAFNLDEWAYICDKTVKAYRGIPFLRFFSGYSTSAYPSGR